MPKFRLSYAGFTLVELLVAISIIGLVAGITISSAASIQRSSRDAQRKTDLSTLQGALQQYYTDQGFYPNELSFSASGELNNCSGRPAGCTKSKVYLQKTPTDPSSSTPYCYLSQKGPPSIVGNTSNCASGDGTAGTCHFYSLCANVENSSQSPSTCYCGGGGVTTYPYGVSPL